MAKPSNIKNPTTIEMHKTSRDGDSAINRRRMLTMTTAFAITSVSANSMVSKSAMASVSPVVATDSSLPTMTDLIANWQALNAASDAESSANDEMYEALQASEPKLPKILRTPILKKDGTIYHAVPDRHDGWDMARLKDMLESKIKLDATRIDRGGGNFDLKMRDRPVPKYCLLQYRERLEALQKYESAHERHWAEHNAREEAWEESLDTLDEAFRAILNYEPTDLAELNIKADFLQSSSAFQDMISCRTITDMSHGIAIALVADIQRLAATPV